MDDVLLKLASAADVGEAFPRLNLLAGNSLFMARPAARSSFEEGSQRQVAEELYYLKKPKKKKKTMDTAFTEATTEASTQMATFQAVMGAAVGASAIILRDA